MKIHEFGDKSNPVILLLPGTMCYWKGNFGGVIDELSKHFLVAAVAYTGFDETDTESYICDTRSFLAFIRRNGVHLSKKNVYEDA